MQHIMEVATCSMCCRRRLRDLRHGAHKKVVNGHEDHAACVCAATLIAWRAAADGKVHVHVLSYWQLRQVGGRQNAYARQPFH
jgi:hypothetical protein